jgi:hypothetical protein
VSWEPGRPKLTPTDGTTVYVVPIASWAQALAGSHHATLVLPRGHWFEWPLGWFADSATKAEASWDHMTCELAIDDTDGAAMQWLDVDLSGASRWRTEDVKLKLPDATLAGVVAGPVIYLPPLRGPRTVTVTFSLDGDRPGARGVADSRTIVVVDVVPEDQVTPQGGRPPVRLGTP